MNFATCSLQTCAVFPPVHATTTTPGNYPIYPPASTTTTTPVLRHPAYHPQPQTLPQSHHNPGLTWTVVLSSLLASLVTPMAGWIPDRAWILFANVTASTTIVACLFMGLYLLWRGLRLAAAAEKPCWLATLKEHIRGALSLTMILTSLCILGGVGLVAFGYSPSLGSANSYRDNSPPLVTYSWLSGLTAGLGAPVIGMVVQWAIAFAVSALVSWKRNHGSTVMTVAASTPVPSKHAGVSNTASVAVSAGNGEDCRHEKEQEILTTKSERFSKAFNATLAEVLPDSLDEAGEPEIESDLQQQIEELRQRLEEVMGELWARTMHRPDIEDVCKMLTATVHGAVDEVVAERLATSSQLKWLRAKSPILRAFVTHYEESGLPLPPLQNKELGAHALSVTADLKWAEEQEEKEERNQSKVTFADEHGKKLTDNEEESESESDDEDPTLGDGAFVNVLASKKTKKAAKARPMIPRLQGSGDQFTEEERRLFQGVLSPEDAEKALREIRASRREALKKRQSLTEEEKSMMYGELEQFWSEGRHNMRYGPRTFRPLTEEEKGMNRGQLARRMAEDRQQRWLEHQAELGHKLVTCEECGRMKRADDTEHHAHCFRMREPGGVQVRRGIPFRTETTVTAQGGAIRVARQKNVDADQLQRHFEAITKTTQKINAPPRTNIPPPDVPGTTDAPMSPMILPETLLYPAEPIQEGQAFITTLQADGSVLFRRTDPKPMT